MKMDIPPKFQDVENIEKKKDISWFESYILKNEKFKIPKTTFPRPFLVQTSEKQYSILNKDGLYFTSPEDFEKVKDAFYKYEWLTGEMDSRANNYTHYDPMHVDYIRETLGKINEIFKNSKKITPDTISEKNLKDSPEKFYEEFQDYLILLEESNREKVEDLFNLKFSDLSLREQFYFLNFIKNKNEQEVSPVKNLTNKYGKNAFRTFLSIEQGGKEMGDKILALGEKLPKESAELVFKKYGEYIDAVDSVAQFIEKEYKLPVSPGMIEKLKEALLLKGKNLLVEQAEKVLESDFSEGKILKSLENSKADVFLFKNMFKIAKENNPEISFEDFVGLLPERITPANLVEKEDLESIRAIIQANYSYDKELGEYAFESLEKAINDNKTDINILRRIKKIIAIDRTDYNEDGSVYFGSFNVDPQYCSSKIGDSFFQATIFPLMKEKIVKADCPIRNPVSAYYIESGFVGNKLHTVAKTELMAIISSPEQNFESKKLSKEEIKKMLNHSNDSKIKVFSNKSQKELPLERVNDGETLTRYFFDKESGFWYIALE